MQKVTQKSNGEMRATKSALWKAANIVTVVMVLMFSLSLSLTPASASPLFAASLCGEGSAPDYGFTYNLQQEHWMVDWQDYASETTVTEVDTILDRLNEDSITQMMILFMPETQVGNRVNCAVHFLRYMKLGNLSGERKDNGFVFLIVVEAARIDVHYGVGLGLPALTAPELTDINRAAEEAYLSTQSMDQAVLTLVEGFDAVARNKYSPLVTPSSTPVLISLPAVPKGPLGILTICGMVCVGGLVLMFVLWLFTQLSRMGFNPSSRSGSYGRGFFPRGGGGSSSPRTRGGGGSGRSGRGN